MSAAERPAISRSRPTVVELAVVAALLALFAAQSVGSMRLLSGTADETSHLPAGFTYLATGEIRLNTQHPPLVKELCALPLLLIEPRFDRDHPGWAAEPPNEWSFGRAFLYGHNDADRLLFWGRMPVVMLALLLGFLVHRWARELGGVAAGIAALFLFALSPNLVAHSHLVTMDLGLACFSLATLYALWRWARRGGWGSLVGCGVALGAALSTKFSGILLVPVTAGLLALACVPRGHSDPERRLRPGRAAAALAGILGIAAAMVWAAYLFPADPGFYLRGLAKVNVDHRQAYPFYLLGEFRYEGFWYYFLAAFVLKTPLPTLLLLPFAAWTCRWRDGRWLDAAFLVVPVAAYVVATSALADNIGLRYLLPVYPFLFVGVAGSVPRLIRFRAGRVGLAALGVWYLAAAAWIYPDHLAYFNVAAGGPSRGYLHLDDSNVEWGEGLKRLEAWVDERGVDRIKLRYPWTASPEYYGIPYDELDREDWVRRPAPGIYAMSTQALIRGRFPAKGLATDWLGRYEPVDRIGYSIYIFEFE